MAHVKIFTDGACSGNPGPIKQGQKKWEPVFRPDLRQQKIQGQKKWEPVFRPALRQQKIQGQKKWEPVFRPALRQQINAGAV